MHTVAQNPPAHIWEGVYLNTEQHDWRSRSKRRANFPGNWPYLWLWFPAETLSKSLFVYHFGFL